MKQYCVRLASKDLIRTYEEYKGVKFDYDDCMESIKVNKYDATTEIVEAETIEEAEAKAIANTRKYTTGMFYKVVKISEA